MKEIQREVILPQDELSGIKIPLLPEPEVAIETFNAQLFPLVGDYSVKRFENVIESQLYQQMNEFGIVDENELLALPVKDKKPTYSSKVIYGDESLKPDYSIACHRLSNRIGYGLGEATEMIARKLESVLPAVRFQATENGYVNIELPPENFVGSILTDIESMEKKYGNQNIGNGKTVVIDLSSPNIAKHFSVGHLRSTIIGETIARIYTTSGFRVIRDNHLGDWGTQFGKLGRAYELWEKDIPELHNPDTAVDGLYTLYVRMNEEIEKEKSDKGHSSLEQEGRDWFKRLESGDQRAREMFQWSWALSMKEFERIYDRLGSSFNYQLGESFYVPMLPEVVQALTRKGLVYDIGDGALAVQFKKGNKNGSLEFINRPLTLEEKESIKNKKSDVELLVVSKRDGASVYSTRDLAALAARTSWFSPDKIIYVVGESQQEYFKMVFSSFSELAQEKTPELVHVPFGLVTLPGGEKMSTRHGKVIFLEDVLNESIKRARDVVSKTSRKVTEEEIEVISRQVGIGAVIFMDIGQGRERQIEFDWDTALSLEGNSAPYIQYAHARCKSLLDKAEAMKIVPRLDIPVVMSDDIQLQQKEKFLAATLGYYPEAIRLALETHEPCKISEYLIKLTDTFNSFYTFNPILRESDEAVRNTRLRLVRATAQVIRNGLKLLNIESPDKM